MRADAGQPSGRILRGIQREETTPTFIWECEYPDLGARSADAAWADESTEFSAVRTYMGTLLDRFERHVFEVD